MLSQRDALAALQWYVDAGVDETTSDAPVNWFALPKPNAKPKPPAAAMEMKAAPLAASPAPSTPAMPTPRPAPAATSVPAYVAQSHADAVAAARKLADHSASLSQLREAIEGFDGCAIKKHSTHTVFADGNPNAPIMFLGEAPSADEDIQGIPFCGVSGKLLDKMLASIGLSRAENAYISNTVFWRPPGNRDPSPDEMAICRPFVEKHIALVKPKLLVLVGGVAAKDMLNETAGITRLRGREHHYRNSYLETALPTYTIFHPSYLLRTPAQKSLAWKDLLQIKQKLQTLS